MPATKAQIEAATAQETEADDAQYVTAPLAGFDGVTKDVRCTPTGRWRASMFRALNSGDIDTFMQAALHPDDVEVYEDLDPTMDGFGAFVEAVGRASGEALGKSRGRSASGNGTRRR
ncbi:hypothetical protein [Streptomyces sp. MJP52]|uniref:hypothetical protein n=1 Tax=Streptomyces sp. MJP52 TaxID=2940555 RepID=UPI002474CA53|nr:hypothetical protein [Streptomyces sp. MJP52]MDH6224363.1 putative membrane-bound mannosyltransferase [Streptomyces sp. MJP52]